MSGAAKRRVLDTTVVSKLMKGDAAAVDRLERCRRIDVLVPQPVLAEIEYGLARRSRSARRTRLEERFRSIVGMLARAPWNDDVSHCFGAIKSRLERRGEGIQDLDVAVAAHALAHHAVLATGNTRHMARVRGLEIEDWAEPIGS